MSEGRGGACQCGAGSRKHTHTHTHLQYVAHANCLPRHCLGGACVRAGTSVCVCVCVCVFVLCVFVLCVFARMCVLSIAATLGLDITYATRAHALLV